MRSAPDPHCPLCAAPRVFLCFWRGFRLYRCRSCGTESVHPLPGADELEAFYQSLSGKKMVRWQRRRVLVAAAFDRYLKRYREISRGRRPQKFLDLGGGVGFYARAALDRDIEACLFEWAEDALRFARGELGLPWTVRGDVGACADFLAGERFDFVLARHVIEHLRNPRRFVVDLTRILRPSGLVAIETPNVETWEQLAHPGVILENFRILRRSNPSLPPISVARRALAKSVSGANPPKHLWGFTAASLSALLESQGFEVVEIHRPVAGNRAHDPLFYDRESSRRSLRAGLHELWERLVSPLFHGRGMHLVALARWPGEPDPRPAT